MIDPGAIPLQDFTDPTTVRLISTAYADAPALAPLADGPAALADLEALAALTSVRRGAALPLPAGVRREELLTEVHGDGWAQVNAAFCYPRATGSRFNGPERGAWYAAHGADAAETAKAEVGWHLTRELEATGVFENVTAYRELVAGFTSRFHDLHGCPGEPFLAADPARGYPAGQALARVLVQEGGNGVLYPSVRRAGGRCLAAFRPNLVQNIRRGVAWEFTWAGEREPVIRPL